MGNYAVYHLEKGNTSSGGIGNHIDRKEGAEHTYRHADPYKKDLNQFFNLNSYCSMPLHEAIEKRIKEGYKSPKAIRKDAVKYTTHILTGSHERMKEIERNPEQLKNWVIENKKFLEQEFGKENIVRFVLHRDEKTPHLHAVTINLTSDGRLSAKEIIGNKKDMQNRQDRYAQAMQSFGLERGLKNTGIKHEDASEYYKRLKKSLEVEKIKDFNVDKTILGVKWATFGVDKDKTIENLKNAVKSQITALESKDISIKKLELDKDAINYTKNTYVQINDELKKDIINLRYYSEQMIFNDKYREDEINRRVSNYINEIKNKIDKSNSLITEKKYNSMIKDGVVKLSIASVYDELTKESEIKLAKLINNTLGDNYFENFILNKITKKNEELEKINEEKEQLKEIQEKEQNNNRSWRRSR